MTPIKDFENEYLINKFGKIFDVKRNRFMNLHYSGVERRNYLQVSLYKHGKRHTKRVHSLMATTFLGHVYGDRKVVVDHIDNNPENNRLSNLQIISMSLNNTKDK